MMSVYENALTASRKGPTVYVLEHGLDILYTQNKASALALLKKGYQIKAHCISGIMYNDWCLTVRNKDHRRVIQQICELLGIENKWSLIEVNVSTFYDKLLRKEAVHMHLDFQDATTKAQIFYNTQKDCVADPTGFEDGQKKAIKILDFLTVISHIPQYSEGVIRYLENTIK